MSDKKETPQEKWHKKVGYISKSFKMYRSQAEAFAKACEKEGRTQASVITELMERYVKEVN